MKKFLRLAALFFLSVTGLLGQSASKNLSINVRAAANTTPTLLFNAAAPLALPAGSGGWPGPGCSNTCYYVPLDSSATTAGSSILLFFSYDSTGSNQVFSVTDDKSDTYSLVVTSAVSNNKTMRVYQATNIVAGVSAIRVQLTSGAQNNFWQPLVLEFSNANSLDGTSCNAATSATISAGTITPTANGDLIVQAKYSTTQTPQTSSFTAGSQSNITWNLASELLGDGAADQYGVYNSTAAINPTFTQAASDSYISCAVALKATTTGSVPTVLPRIFLQEHDAMPKNAPNPWTAGISVNALGAVYLIYVGNDAIHSTGGVLDGVTSVPAPSVGWTTGADFVGSNGHNHVNAFCAQFNTPPGNVLISINRTATTNDSINMLYVVPGGTCNVDVDSGGTTGNQLTGTAITLGTLTPTKTNDMVFGFGGQFDCTGTSISSPANGQFDTAWFTGLTVDGPAQTDENNFWFHSINTDLSTITATVQDVCTGSTGNGSPSFWAGRLVAYQTSITALQDFQARCAAAGVIVCQGFDTAAIFSTGFTPSTSNGTVMTQDTTTARSGGSSAHCVVPAQTGPDACGSFVQSFGQTFGQNSTFYVQFAQKIDANVLNQHPANTYFKQDIVASIEGGTCASKELTTVNLYDRGQPGMYSQCGGDTFQIAIPTNDFLLEQGDQSTALGDPVDSGFNCHYQTQNNGPNSCATYPPSVWVTYYYKFNIGTFGQPNSNIFAWRALPGQGYVEWIKITNHTLLNNEAGTGFNIVDLLNYYTSRNGGVAYGSTGNTWYDELIVSTQPIAAPAVAPSLP